MNKTIQIKDIYNIFSKYGDLNINVNTPYGYKKILDCDITAKNSKVIKTKVESGLFVKTSPDHLLKTKNGRFKKVSELQPGSYIKTKNGNEKIKSIEYLKNKLDLYDIQVSDVEQYYSNGIVSHNSALLDALSFCLFDTCSRAFKADNVLNNKKKDFFCKVNFEIDGQDYYIERVAKRQRNNHVKLDVDFYMYDETGDKVSMNGDQRRTTNTNIRRVIGSYEDFLLTSLSSQINNSVFIEKTQKEKKQLLAQFMGLEIFDKLWVAASNEIKDVSAVLKNFKENDWEVELVDIKEQKKKFKNEYDQLLSEKEVVDNKRSFLEKNIINLTKKLKTTDKSIEDIDNLKDNKDMLKDTLNRIDNELGDTSIRIEKINLLNTELCMKMQNHKNDKTEENFIELENLEIQKTEIATVLDKMKIEVRSKLDKIDKLGNLQYDDNCEYCMKNPFRLDAIETEKKLEIDKDEVKEYLIKMDSIVHRMDHLNYVRERKLDLNDVLDKLQKVSSRQNELDSQFVLLKEKRKNVLHQISMLEEKIIKYYNQEKDIVYNQQIKLKIRKLEVELNDTVSQCDDLNNDINDVYSEIKVVDSKKRSILNNIKKVEKLEGKYKAYEYYLDAIKRDGVPYELITKALPTIEGEVNNILAQLVDFQMIFEMDGKNINNYIVYNDDNVWSLELSSGMERFISSLAIRVGLINVTNLPRSNFLAIDEGFGTMDSDNINSVYQLFQYLKTQFQFTLIVSHIDSMRDTVDTLLEIKKDSDFSNINFC